MSIWRGQLRDEPTGDALERLAVRLTSANPAASLDEVHQTMRS